MINSHQFQQAAKQFRAGRISLKEFTDLVIHDQPARKPNEASASSTGSEAESPGQVAQAALEPTKILPRAAESHKGDFGRVLTIGGSSEMAGAIGLTSLAALRSGAGLVRAIVPREIQTVVAGWSPSLMTVGIESKNGKLKTKATSILLATPNGRMRLPLGLEWDDRVISMAGCLRFIVTQKDQWWSMRML